MAVTLAPPNSCPDSADISYGKKRRGRFLRTAVRFVEKVRAIDENTSRQTERRTNIDMQTTNRLPTTLGALLFFIVGLGPFDAPAQAVRSLSDSNARPESLKGKALARGLSLGTTAVPVGIGVNAMLQDGNFRQGAYLIGGGLLLGPSTGLLYAEAPRRAVMGIGIRAGIGTGSAALSLAGASIAESREGSFAGLGMLAGGVAAGTIYTAAHASLDIFIFSANAVEEHHEAVRRKGSQRQRVSVSVSPWLSPQNGTPGVGVHVSL